MNTEINPRLLLLVLIVNIYFRRKYVFTLALSLNELEQQEPALLTIGRDQEDSGYSKNQVDSEHAQTGLFLTKLKFSCSPLTSQ